MQNKRRGKRELARRQATAANNAKLRAERGDVGQVELLLSDKRPGNSTREILRLTKKGK